MSRDDILRMAAKSNIALYGMGLEKEKFIRHLEQFADLVASAEREDICKFLEREFASYERTDTVIAAIRARGQA
jgi:hypothetical protein